MYPITFHGYPHTGQKTPKPVPRHVPQGLVVLQQMDPTPTFGKRNTKTTVERCHAAQSPLADLSTSRLRVLPLSNWRRQVIDHLPLTGYPLSRSLRAKDPTDNNSPLNTHRFLEDSYIQASQPYRWVEPRIRRRPAAHSISPTTSRPFVSLSLLIVSSYQAHH